MSKFNGITESGRGQYVSVGVPMLVVYTNGYGRFNKAAIEEFLDGVETVSWYHNPEDRQLGIGLGEREDAEPYSLTPNRSGANVSVNHLLWTVGADPDALGEKVPLSLEHDDEHDLLVADLEPLYAALGESEGEDEGEDGSIPPEITEDDVDTGRYTLEDTEGNPFDDLDAETLEMIPDGWSYEEIEALCQKYDGVYPVADELGLSRSKGAFLLRKLGLLDYMGQPTAGDER